MAAKHPKRIATFTQAALYTIIVIAILAVLNFLANRYNRSYDATANKRYTLSDQTVQVARNLKQDVTISYWNRPEEFPNAKDLFDRYGNLSPRIQVLYQDIDKKRTEAIAAGVEARGDIIVEAGNKREKAKSLTEEEVTGALVRALKGGDRMVCFTSGYGDSVISETDEDGYSGAKELTERNNYKTKEVALIPLPEIPKECTILVVGGPKRNYLPPAVDAIKKYVEEGGRALIMLDPPLKFGAQVDENPALTALLDSWGAKLNKDLVLDLSGVGQVFGLGPQFPIVADYQDHAIVRQMGGLATGFPITRSMEAANGANTQVSALLATTDEAMATEDLSSARISVAGAKKGARTLAVAGQFNAPAGAPADAPKGRFVVVGTSRWISNNFLAFNGNRDLYMNMLNWLSSDEDLIAIRPKDPEDRRLNMNAQQVTMLFYGSVVGLPLLMALAGFAVWWRRR
jgi:ABC-type uncharacterized transport system involved in gliding motility auxiliary subunit